LKQTYESVLKTAA